MNMTFRTYARIKMNIRLYVRRTRVCVLRSPVQLNSAEKPFSICRFSDQNILHFIANRILSHVVETKIDGSVCGVVVGVLGVTITTHTHTHPTRIVTFQVWCKQTKPFWLQKILLRREIERTGSVPRMLSSQTHVDCNPSIHCMSSLKYVCNVRERKSSRVLNRFRETNKLLPLLLAMAPGSHILHSARAQTDRIFTVQIRETKWDLFYLPIYYTDSSQLTQVSTQCSAIGHRPCMLRTKKLISIEGTSAYEDLHSINPEINLAAS